MTAGGPSTDRRPAAAQALAMNPMPLLAIGGMWMVFAGSWGLYFGGNTAARLAGQPTAGGYGRGLGFFIALFFEGGPAGIWPTVPGPLLAVSAIAGVVIAATPLAVVGWWLLRALRTQDPFSGVEDFAAFTKNHRTTETRRLGSKPANRLTGTGIVSWGIPIGELDGETIYSGPEDVAVTFFGPRAGKSTSVAVPAILAAPGPCIATSNKGDLVATTRAARDRIGSRTWVFDPARIVHEHPGWCWDPLDGVNEVEDAMRLASVFVPKQADDRNQFFTDSAREYLSRLFLAAAVSPEHTMIDVRRWLYTNGDPEPVTVLRRHGLEGQAEALAGFLGGQARETADNIFTTARTGASSLSSEHNLRWIVPTPGVPRFDVEQFLTQNETLYLLSREGELSSAPIIAAFTQRVLRAAETAATARPGGRLDPFLSVVLDEAANIVKIGELPDYYSHYGSRGILVNSIFQNYSQAEAAWGKIGARKLWSAATVKLIGPGTDDPTMTRELATLIGKHQINVTSYSHNMSHGGGGQLNAQNETILDEAAIRGIPKGEALMFATAHPPTQIDLQPWYHTARASELAADIKAFEEQMINRIHNQPTSAPTPALFTGA